MSATSSTSPRQSQSPPPTPHGSKLSRLLSKSGRDRSRSMVDNTNNNDHHHLPSAGSSSSSISEASKIRPSRIAARPSSRKGSDSRDTQDRRRQSQDPHSPSTTPDTDTTDDDFPHSEQSPRHDIPEDTPVIVEPVAIPRPRTRSERPLSDNYPAVAFYPSSSSTARLSDLPSRLSGWFAHTFSSSSTDLTNLPSLLSQQHIASTTTAGSSPKGKGSALLTAAKHGTTKVMRRVLDSDATPDKCEDPIWLLGVLHSGYEPPPPVVQPTLGGRRSSVGSTRRPPSSLSSSSASSPIMPGGDASLLSQSQPASVTGSASSSASAKDPGRYWPPVFYADFSSRIWLTYRSQFIPIRDVPLEELDAPPPASAVSASPQPKRSFWPLGGEKCWASDAGWGCMVRTGQSLLANTLLIVHLGRDWRKPPHPELTVDYATYVQILSWFLDDPSCPFSVHRMTIVGKQLGTRIGQWFGPAIAAQAIRTLVRSFPECGLGVFYAGDGGTVYESEVIAASHGGIGFPRKHVRRYWGDRAVLILIGQKLGLSGVNEIYHNAVKEFLKWPQSVGIAGGRPSSSYYFVGTQADSLFYLDPHHARPAIPLRPTPSAPHPAFHSPSASPSVSRHTSPEPHSSSDHERSPRPPSRHVRSPTSPASVRSRKSSFSHRNVVSPSPLQQQISTSSSSTTASYTTTNTTNTHSSGGGGNSPSPQPPLRWRSSVVMEDDADMDSRELGVGEDLDSVQRHYATAYSATELNTFHCDRVRKMPLSGMDPSMLIGFLCRDENDWLDLKRRITELNESNRKAIVITLQDEPPNWTSDSDMGLESISEPDIDLPDEDDEDEEEFSDAQDNERERDGSASPDHHSLPSSGSHSRTGAEEGDTEDDPVDPVTPGAGRSSFVNILPPGVIPMQKSDSTGTMESASSGVDSLSFDDEDEVEWVSREHVHEHEEDVMTPHQGYSSTMARAHTHEGEEDVLLAESQATIGGGTHSRHGQESSASAHMGTKKKKGTKKRHANSSTESNASKAQYPFPASSSAGADDNEEALLSRPPARRVPQMRTAKARDGGRTQSGGVRGVPADDLDDL